MGARDSGNNRDLTWKKLNKTEAKPCKVSSDGLGVLAGSKIDFFRQAPTGNQIFFFSQWKGKKEVTNWRAALNFILIDLAENQSYCLYNYCGVK